MSMAGSRPGLRAMLLAGCVLVPAVRASAQTSDLGPPTLQVPNSSLLPPLGADPTSPGLSDRLSDLFGLTTPPQTSASAGPGWQFKPQITVSEEFTDNAAASGGPALGPQEQGGNDFITMVQPRIAVSNTSDRLRVTLNYDPTAEIYSENTSYSQVRQDGTADALATILPDLFYFDARGSITQQPVYGGFGAVNIDTLPPQQQETLSSVSLSPYVSHGFGGFGTGQAGVGYIYSAAQAPSYLNNNSIPDIGLAGAYGSYWLATKRIFANFATGEDFARFQNVIATDNSFYDASTALRGSQRVTVTDDASYAINRFVSALGEIGYENLSYPNEGFSYVGGTWAAGVRLTPGKDSAITLEYRYIDGSYAPYIYGSWQVTPRLHVFGGYSEGITSFEQDQQDTLLSGTQGSTGVNASALVAAPVLNNANYFGGNQSLNRARRLDITAAWLGERDTFTASLDYQRTNQVGNPEGLPNSTLALYGITPGFLDYILVSGIPAGITGFQRAFLEAVLSLEHLTTQTSTNLVGGLTWGHQLRPDLSLQLYGGYSRTKQAYTTDATRGTALVTATLSYNFTETLIGRAAFAGTYEVGNQGNYGGLYNENADTFTLSVTKSF